MSHDPRGKADSSDKFIAGSSNAAARTPVAADLQTFFDIDSANAWSKATLTAIGALISSLAFHPDDDPGSIFVIGPIEHDFGSSASAVATKLTDSAPVKTRVLAAFMILTEAKAGGTGDDVTCLAKDASAVTKMTGDVTLDMSDTVFMNHLDSVVGVVGVSGADGVVSATSDIYIYTDAQGSRSAGKYQVIAICQKTA